MMHHDAVPVPTALSGRVVILAELVFAGLAVDEPDVTGSKADRRRVEVDGRGADRGHYVRRWRRRCRQVAVADLGHRTVDVAIEAQARHCGLLQPHRPDGAGTGAGGTARAGTGPAKRNPGAQPGPTAGNAAKTGLDTGG